MTSLIEEDDEGIQEQVLNLVRNIGCGKVEHVEEVFNGFGVDRFIGIIENKLKSKNSQILIQVLKLCLL